MAMSLDAADRQWIADLLEANMHRIEENIHRVEERVNASEGRLREEFSEKLEGMETRLLTAFHEWASPVALRLDSNRAALRTFDIELETLQNRVKKIEEKLGIGLI